MENAVQPVLFSIDSAAISAKIHLAEAGKNREKFKRTLDRRQSEKIRPYTRKAERAMAVCFPRAQGAYIRAPAIGVWGVWREIKKEEQGGRHPTPQNAHARILAADSATPELASPACAKPELRFGEGRSNTAMAARKLGICVPPDWTPPHESVQHNPMHFHPLHAELVKRQPDKHQARFYRLAVWPDLFGGYSLAREYGRIGQLGKLRLDPYPEEAQAINALHKLFRRKTRRGYIPITGRST